MITIHDFGWRLGNQLFQLACAKSLAEDNMDEVAYPEWKYAKYFEGNFPVATSEVSVVHPERVFHYEPIPYQRNISIQGYRQSVKYFKNNEKLIRKMFRLKQQYDIYSSLSQSEEQSCAIHVRRTDYLNEQNKPYFHEMQMSYYHEAMELMISKLGKVNFLVFSDDLEWCKENFASIPNCTVDGSSDEMVDFAKMKNCDNFIIGNSTFSWWAAYLNRTNPYKIVVAPSQDKWFGPALSHYDTSDLIPQSWIRI